jgi:hypothetical protein
MTETAGSGYPQGQVIYSPNVPLSEGGHIVELKASDWAGNEVAKKWSFTVDTNKPVLSLTSISDLTYTNQNTIELDGWSETDAEVGVMVGALSVEVKRDAVGGFSANVSLEEGENRLMVNATDIAGNEVKKIITVILDTEIPTFERVVCKDGTLTNEANTALTGSISEEGTMTVNGDPTSVNSDGTFDKFIELTEGENVFALEFMDLAGNVANSWLNVTLDTQAPTIVLDQFDTTVKTDSMNITGTVEAGANIKVNGKPVQVEETRQQIGSFSKLVRLSPGQNTLVIESEDTAGNAETLYLAITYDSSDTGTNYGAIGLMILLLVIGLLIGIFVARMILGERPPKGEEEEDVPTVEEDTEEAPEETVVDTVVEPDDDYEEPDVDEEISGEPIPDEEYMPEELPEEEADFEPEDGEVEPEVEELPEEESEISEPIEEDDMASSDEFEEVASSEELEVAEQPPESLDEEAIEIEPEEPEITEPEVELVEKPEEDERVLKLRKAYEEGKISKELFEKNLAKFKED